MQSNEEIEARVRAFLEHKRIDRVRDYMARGRQHERLSDAALREKWCTAFAVMARDPSNMDFQRQEEDFQAELDIRGIEIPFEEVRPHFDAMLAASRAASAELAADPQRKTEIGRAMLQDLEEHERALEHERYRPN